MSWSKNSSADTPGQLRSSNPITVGNPKRNCERVHQVMGNEIRTFELQTKYLDEGNPWKGILSSTAFAMRCTYLSLHSSPGQLIFGRDLIFNIKHTANGMS